MEGQEPPCWPHSFRFWATPGGAQGLSLCPAIIPSKLKGSLGHGDQIQVGPLLCYGSRPKAGSVLGKEEVLEKAGLGAANMMTLMSSLTVQSYPLDTKVGPF